MRFFLATSALLALASAQNFLSIESEALSLASALYANTGNPALESTLEAQATSLLNGLEATLSAEGINVSTLLPGIASGLLPTGSAPAGASPTAANTGSGSGSGSSSSKNHAPAPTAMGLSAAAVAGLAGVAALL